MRSALFKEKDIEFLLKPFKTFFYDSEAKIEMNNVGPFNHHIG